MGDSIQASETVIRIFVAVFMVIHYSAVDFRCISGLMNKPKPENEERHHILHIQLYVYFKQYG